MQKKTFVNVQLINKDLICCICCSVFQEPVKIICKHKFCYLCIMQSFNYKKLCPLCRSQIKNLKFQKDLILVKMVGNLKVYCNYYGCDWLGVNSEFKQHLRQFHLQQKEISISNNFIEVTDEQFDSWLYNQN